MEQDREQRRVARTLYAALLFVFGLQSMRFFFASLTWYLRDTRGVAVLDLIPIAFAPFLLAVILPAVSRWIGFRNALAAGTAVLVIARVANQVATDPGPDLWFSAIATFAFVGLLPFVLGLGRSALVGGLLVGLAIDSAIKGLGLSLDLAFQPGWRAVVAVAAISVGLVWAFAGLGGVKVQGVRWRSGAPLLALAPLLFIQLLLLQSQGWTAEMTGSSGHGAQLRIAVLNVVAVYLAHKMAGNRVLTALALAVVVAAAVTAEGNPTVYNFVSLVAIPAAGLVWANLVPSPDRDRLGVSSFYLLTAASLFLVFGLAYYVPLDMNLGFDAPAVRIAAALVLALFGLGAVFSTPGLPALGRGDWLLAAAAAILPVAAFVSAIGVDTETNDDASDPIRFVSYNIHSAFNTDGVLDVAAIAQVIEDTEAEVVALQEVPRGQLISATTDILTLLRLELGFEHVAFFGTTDPVWGNAVLSRYPIVDVDTEHLPRVGTPMRRGYLGVTIDTGDVEVLVISTHLQHVNDSSVHDEDPEADLLPVHTEQIATILARWAGAAPAVLMGDFNARPDWAQVAMILEAGWVDSWLEAGSGDGHTSNSVDPSYRIDYVFHTPDLTAVDAGIFLSTASDHLAVIADLSFAE